MNTELLSRDRVQLSTFFKEEKIAIRCTLSRREIEVFKLIGRGCTSKEIAVKLHISKETVSGLPETNLS